MRRWLGWIAIVWLLVICSVALVTYGTPPVQASLDDRTRAVAQQLRCPVCQGESVADSPSGLAHSMRAIIRHDLAHGKTPESIKARFVTSYGNWVLLSPPSSGIGEFAWLVPPFLVVAGAGLLITMVVDWRNRGRDTPIPQRSSYIDRVRREVAADWPEESLD